MEKEEICIRIINENIKRVFEDKPLTMPLAKLNRSCKFKKMYNAHWDFVNEDKIKAERREKKRKWIKENPEKAKELYKEKYKKYRDKILERQRKSWLENPEKFREISRKSYHKNREKNRDRDNKKSKKYYFRNREKILKKSQLKRDGEFD